MRTGAAVVDPRRYQPSGGRIPSRYREHNSGSPNIGSDSNHREFLGSSSLDRSGGSTGGAPESSLSPKTGRRAMGFETEKNLPCGPQTENGITAQTTIRQFRWVL